MLAGCRVRKPRHCYSSLVDTLAVPSSARPVACGTSVQITGQQGFLKPPNDSQTPSAFKSWLQHVRTGKTEPSAHAQAAAEAGPLHLESSFQKAQISRPVTPGLWNQPGSQVKQTDPDQVERIMLNQGSLAAECDTLLVLYQDDSKACQETEGVVRTLPLYPAVADCTIQWCAALALISTHSSACTLSHTSELIASCSDALLWLVSRIDT